MCVFNHHHVNQFVILVEVHSSYSTGVTAHVSYLILVEADCPPTSVGKDNGTVSISQRCIQKAVSLPDVDGDDPVSSRTAIRFERCLLHLTFAGSHDDGVVVDILFILQRLDRNKGDRKSTRLNSSHVAIS